MTNASLTRGGQPVYLQLVPHSDPLAPPFGAGSFANETAHRSTTDIRCSPQLQACLEKIDAWACLYRADHRERLFKGKVLPEYRNAVHAKADYTPAVRCKLNVAGHRA